MKKIIFLSLLIAGCASPQERVARQEAYMQKLRGQCYGYGFQGGAEMAQCVMQLDAILKARNQAEGFALMGMGASMMQNAGPQPIGTRCITTPAGNTQQTVCH